MAKKKRKKKKQDSYVRFIWILIALAAAAAVISLCLQKLLPSRERQDTAAYFSITDGNKLGLSVDGTVVEDGARLIGDSVCVSLDTAMTTINRRLYLDESEGRLCVTTPTVFRSFTYDELVSSGDMIREGDTRYLTLAFLETWTDMTCTRYEDPGYLFIRTDFKYEQVSAVKDGVIRVRPTDKAAILCDVTAGETLQVLEREDAGEDFTAVCSDSGLAGYIRRETVTAVAPAGADHVSTIGEYTSLKLDDKVNMAFYMTNNAQMNATLQDKLNRGVTGINVVAPTWFFLDGPSSITSICDQAFVDTCHAAGYQVWALLNDIDGQAASTADTLNALKGTTSRQAIIADMIRTVTAMGIDGINVDLERVSEEGAPAYLEFLRELSVECRNRGLFLSVDTYVPMNYSLYLDREEQGTVADYVVIMCYDEHYAGSTEAGSVASIGFMENGIQRTLREVPADKIVAAVPFYTRLWETTDTGAVSSRILSMSEAADYIRDNNMEVYWDENVGQYVAERMTETGTEQIWQEEARSIGEKMALIREFNLAGAAQWRMGEETPDIWPVIEAGLS